MDKSPTYLKDTLFKVNEQITNTSVTLIMESTFQPSQVVQNSVKSNVGLRPITSLASVQNNIQRIQALLFLYSRKQSTMGDSENDTQEAKIFLQNRMKQSY